MFPARCLLTIPHTLKKRSMNEDELGIFNRVKANSFNKGIALALICQKIFYVFSFTGLFTIILYPSISSLTKLTKISNFFFLNLV